MAEFFHCSQPVRRRRRRRWSSVRPRDKTPEGVPSGVCLATKKRKEKQTGMPGDTGIRGSQIRVKSKKPIQPKCKSGTFVFFSFFLFFLSLSPSSFLLRSCYRQHLQRDPRYAEILTVVSNVCVPKPSTREPAAINHKPCHKAIDI